jgi:phospholipase/carboxylesterase
MASNLTYHVRRPAKLGVARPPVLLILHGYGADEFDLLSLADYLDDQLLVISLRAPIVLDQGGHAWYHLTWTTTNLKADDESRTQSETILTKELPNIIEQEGGDPNNVYLMGFSQGAAMCFALLGRHDLASHGITVKGLMALSGYIPQDVLPILREKRFDNLPVLITHGEFDDLIPAIAMDQSEAAMRHTGAKVTAKLYQMGHGLLPETIEDISRWYRKQITSIHDSAAATKH